MTPEREHQVLSGRYELERILRTDAFGKTWRAIDLKEGGRVDVRIFPEWADRDLARARFARVSTLQHDRISNTLEFIEEGDLAAFVLTANDGETIQQRRSRRPRKHFEISDIKPWLRSIVDPIAYLHSQNVAHGALHIGCILIDGTDLAITDLAASPLLLPQESLQLRSALPAAVLSPQVLRGDTPELSDDIYALAALIYDLLTGQPVFHSGDIHTQVTSLVPPSVEERRAQLQIVSIPLPAAWENWIASALSKDGSRRPSLEDLSLLIRSGQFGGGTTTPTSSGHPSAPASESSPSKPSPKLRISGAGLKPSILIPVGLVALALVSVLGIYFFNVRPRQEFKAELDSAFATVQSFDESSTLEHDEVISRWTAFETEWAPRIKNEQPGFQSILAEAQLKKQSRDLAKIKDAELARIEKEQKLKARIASARAELEIARLKTGRPQASREESMVVWKDFIASFDVEFEGEKPVEIKPMLEEASGEKSELEKAIAAEVAEKDSFIAGKLTELQSLNEIQIDPNLSAKEKLKRIEATLAACKSPPASVKGDPTIAMIVTILETKKTVLQSDCQRETPTKPLDIDQLFADSTCRAFSKNGKQQILQKAQTALTEKGKYDGKADGTTGEKTHKALLSFQEDQKLIPTAALDDATLAALQIGELTDVTTPIKVATASSSKSGSSGRRKSKPKPEEKGNFAKGVDAVKKGVVNAGKAIGGIFTGDSKTKGQTKGNTKKK
jgi:serine/threonine protein kinase